MENFALITLVQELKEAVADMRVRRITGYPGRGFFLETRSGRMPGLRLSIDARSPLVWVPSRPAPERADADDFVMVLRKHLLSGQLKSIEKPLSERIVEFHFRTALPTEDLRNVSLVAELLPSSPNLLLLDQGRRILASALPIAPQRGVSQFDVYRYPETGKVPLDTVTGPETSWFDEDGFSASPHAWLVGRLAGVGPVLASELAWRSRSVTGLAVPDLIRDLVRQLQQPADTAWVYTAHPLSVVLKAGDPEALRRAVISPIELTHLGGSRSCQTFPGMLAGVAAIRDGLEAAEMLERMRSPELRRTRRELRQIQHQRDRLLERKRRFEEALKLRPTASLLAASGAEMDRHYAALDVTDYTDSGPVRRSIPLDPARTLRENISRMFRRHQKAGRGVEMVEAELGKLALEEGRVEARLDRLESLTHWEAWLATSGTGVNKKEQKENKQENARPRGAGGPPRRRYRHVSFNGHEILIGRNSRENDELTFRVAGAHDFWFHVADYSGSHVIVRNPSGAEEPGDDILVRAAQLAAFHSQARNSAKVNVHYTQRRFVAKPKKARPGLVVLREFRTATVEPTDWTREDTLAVARESGTEAD